MQLHVAYGSETGVATSIAERIHRDAVDRGYEASTLLTLDEAQKLDLHKGQWCFVIVVSSTGDGEPPSNACRFWRYLRDRTKSSSHLSGVSYALLGLGDSNYSTFMGNPKKFRRRLQALGAVPFYDWGQADDATGLEDVVEPWIASLWPALQVHSERMAALPPSTQDAAAEPTRPLKERVAAARRAHRDKVAAQPPPEPMHIGPAPSSASVSALQLAGGPDRDLVATWSPVLSSRMLTCPTAVKQVVELCLQVPSHAAFKDVRAGDSFSIMAPNPAQLVQDLITALGVKGDDSIVISGDAPSHLHQGVTTLEHLFTWCIDIRAVPSRRLLRLLSACATDEHERDALHDMSTKLQSKAFAAMVRQRQCLADVLRQHSSCQVNVMTLLPALPALRPRHYSIANHPLAESEPASLRIVFTLVNVPLTDPTATFQGSCSSWLYLLGSACSGGTGPTVEASPGVTALWPSMGSATSQLQLVAGCVANDDGPAVPIVPRLNTAFRWCCDSDTQAGAPVIMIGPGSGVAPFLGFLQQWRSRQKTGSCIPNKAILFFGCRHPDKDWLYKADMEQARDEGLLTQLHVAFSRVHDEPVYVQDLLVQEGDLMWQLISQQAAHVYVCGDAAGMAIGVEEAWVTIISKHNACSRSEGRDYLERLRETKRFHMDVWA